MGSNWHRSKPDNPADHRLERLVSPSLQNWKSSNALFCSETESNVSVSTGWGRIHFGHTFSDPEELARRLTNEESGKRDIAIYIKDPHVVLAFNPNLLFLDPSHTYRLWFDRYLAGKSKSEGFIVRKVQDHDDIEAMNQLYRERGMVPIEAEVLYKNRTSRLITYLVAADEASGEILGAVMGIDHKHAFKDPENGSSLWSLAVRATCPYGGVGESLVRHLVEYFIARGRSYLDLSVLYDNEQAIQLYEKLYFERVPVFCVKHKNSINEPLFTPSSNDAQKLNPYAQIIIDEAHRRGIAADIIDRERAYFRLTFGSRSILCRESLTDLTSAVAMSMCADKQVTHRVLAEKGFPMPEQTRLGELEEGLRIFRKHGSVVVKPVDGEQGQNVYVDLRDWETIVELEKKFREEGIEAIVEQYVAGSDLRVVVINYRVCAAAIRKPAAVTGDGKLSISALIERQSKRRQRATGGESSIPIDGETKRCLSQAGYDLSTILPKGQIVQVRNTANLHTGGTIHDVTDRLPHSIAMAAEEAARALHIPVVGFDFIVEDFPSDRFVIIEANERPGLANHEPQPLVERFVDFLFPNTQSIE